MKTFILICLAAALVPGVHANNEVTDGTAVEPSKDEIRFRVTGLRDARGALACGLFLRDGWLRRGRASDRDEEITDGVGVCVFRDVAPGAYGVSSYHDENGNGKLDSNFFRIPKEGTAASNDARGKMGPPKFADARFVYEGGILELEATMVYLGKR
ncbi:MAG: DUF2141 domain-containing protein [bacterium]|nr:DUF2141 domain-containing protein [bacterium]